MQIEGKISNIWEYKVSNNANIVNFVYLWKTRIINRWMKNDYFSNMQMNFLDESSVEV